MKRALEYLGTLAKESAGDAGLSRDLASAYRKVGEFQGYPYFANLGDTVGCLSSLRTAVEMRETLYLAILETAVSSVIGTGASTKSGSFWPGRATLPEVSPRSGGVRCRGAGPLRWNHVAGLLLFAAGFGFEAAGDHGYAGYMARTSPFFPCRPATG